MASEWRHVFPFLYRNKCLRETLSRKQFKKIEEIGFQQKVENEPFYKTAISNFIFFRNFEANKQKLLFQNV